METREKDPMAACKAAIVEKLQWGDPSVWTKGKYKHLSELIAEESRIHISTDTLKRILGGKRWTREDYKPQMDTKNALVRFLGYPDWNKFEADFQENPEKHKLPPSASRPIQVKKRAFPYPWVIFGIFLLAGFLILKWIYKPTETPQKAIIPVWSFEILNPIDTTPFTLRVKYKIKAGSSDTFSLNYQSEILNPSDSILTLSSFRPNYSWMVLKYKGSNLKAVPVHSMSRGWEVFNELHGPSLANFQISKPYFFSEKGLGLLPSWFTDLKQDSLSFDQRIVNFKNFGLDCDNFTVEFETTTLEPKHFCSLITFRLFGSLKHLECRMGPSHCSHYNFVNISERFLNGANVDLNKMSHPYGQKNLTRIEVKKRHARIFVNEKEVFSDAYEKPTGDLKGVSIGVNGFAYLHSFKAWDAKGKLVVDDQFGKK